MTQPIVIELISIPANANPYRHDLTRQGTGVGSREIEIMWFSGSLEDFVIVDIETGRRWKVVLPSHPLFNKLAV
jgi:hypothetical protein